METHCTIYQLSNEIGIKTVTDCLELENDGYFYIEYSDTVEKMQIADNFLVSSESVFFDGTIVDTTSTEIGEILVYR